LLDWSNFFSAFATEEDYSIDLKTGPGPLFLSRGFGFITFNNYQLANLCFQILSSTKFVNSPLMCTWAEDNAQNTPIDDEIMAKVSTVHIANLNFEVTDEIIKIYFGQFGEILKCHIVRNPNTSVSRGYAFAEFKEREDCLRAINELNDTEFFGQKLSVSLARPLDEKAKKAKSIQFSSRGVSNAGYNSGSYGSYNRGGGNFSRDMPSGSRGAGYNPGRVGGTFLPRGGSTQNSNTNRGGAGYNQGRVGFNSSSRPGVGYESNRGGSNPNRVGGSFRGRGGNTNQGSSYGYNSNYNQSSNYSQNSNYNRNQQGYGWNNSSGTNYGPY